MKPCKTNILSMRWRSVTWLKLQSNIDQILDVSGCEQKCLNMKGWKWGTCHARNTTTFTRHKGMNTSVSIAPIPHIFQAGLFLQAIRHFPDAKLKFINIKIYQEWNIEFWNFLKILERKIDSCQISKHLNKKAQKYLVDDIALLKAITIKSYE